LGEIAPIPGVPGIAFDQLPKDGPGLVEGGECLGKSLLAGMCPADAAVAPGHVKHLVAGVGVI
jgi:hypothetical protein